MARTTGCYNLQIVLVRTICNLFRNLDPSTYDDIAPNLEYWIEYGLDERLTTINSLVEQVSLLAWKDDISHSCVSRFLKEFHGAPSRSERARSLVDGLCLHILRWFAVASANDIGLDQATGWVALGGGPGFVSAASLVGHLIQCGLLGRGLVRRHLSKPLTVLYYDGRGVEERAVRTCAVYRLFAIAGNTLLRGFLEPEDVQVWFGRMEGRLSLGRKPGLDAPDIALLNEFREIHAAWLRQSEEEEQRNATVTQLSIAEAETTVTPVDHPSTNAPSPTVQVTESVQTPQTVESSLDTFFDVRASMPSSPTPSISTVSDLTPNVSGDDTEAASIEQINVRHDTFCFEDGNVEIVCEETVFCVHSTILSFASSNLRDILSGPLCLHLQIPGRCPRFTLDDSAEDFATLLRMIYTPGFPARNRVPEFTVFASLLRMTSKYGFPDIHEALIEELKGAYPTKWEDFEVARVLGEDVFGSPKPHPNAVLSLFLEQGVKFASPFAAYRAGLGSLSSLASEEPGATLPRSALASIIYGMGELRRVATVAAHSIVYIGNPGMCIERDCLLNPGHGRIDQRMEALNHVYNVVVGRNESDMLVLPSLRDPICEGCANQLETKHLNWRKRFFWVRLPMLLGWTSWDGV